MASFRAHISFGIAFGVIGVLAMISFALAPAEWGFVVLIFLAVVIGAILPDMDSDSSLPFHVTFGSLALIAGGLSFLYALVIDPGNYWLLVAYTLGSMVLVWGVFGSIFKKFTRHRGMAHSIPAAVLAGLVVFTIAVRTGFDEWGSFLLGLALTIGYILHLTLDEVYAGVNFHGKLFVPNKAFGSALKLYSLHHKNASALTYLALLGLLIINRDMLLLFFTRLIDAL